MNIEMVGVLYTGQTEEVRVTHKVVRLFSNNAELRHNSLVFIRAQCLQ